MKIFMLKHLGGIKTRVSGFTLLEVMIAVAVIAVSLTALLGLQSQSISLANEAKINTIATLLAQSKMAEISAYGSDGLTATSGDFGDDFPDFRWDVDEREASVGAAANLSDYLRQADLIVSRGHGGRHGYSIRAYHFVSEIPES